MREWITWVKKMIKLWSSRCKSVIWTLQIVDLLVKWWGWSIAEAITANPPPRENPSASSQRSVDFQNLMEIAVVVRQKIVKRVRDEPKDGE